MTRPLVAALLLVAWTTAHARTVVPVTTCGQLIDRGQVGMLMNDLACGHQWGSCVTCANCSTPIELSIPCSGPADCPDPSVNKCDGGEAVPSVGVYVVPGGRLALNGHTISGVMIGVLGTRRDWTGGNGSVSVAGPGTVFATREAMRFSRGSLRAVTLYDNLYGVVATKARLKDVDTSRNTIGVSVFETVRARRLTSDDNRFIGLLSYGRARVTQSHLTGSDGPDITTEDPPRVSATICDHSAALVETGTPGIYSPTGPPWGVCSGD